MAISTSEAEYVAIDTTSQTFIVWKQILVESGLMEDGERALKCENQAALAMLDKINGTTRPQNYIYFRHKILHPLIQHSILLIRHVETTVEKADMFTKSLQNQTFTRQFQTLNIGPIEIDRGTVTR